MSFAYIFSLYSSAVSKHNVKSLSPYSDETIKILNTDCWKMYKSFTRQFDLKNTFHSHFQAF